MKDKFKDTKGLDKAYMSLAKHYDERKENAIRQVKDGAFVDLLNQEMEELQNSMKDKEKQIEEIERMTKIIYNTSNYSKVMATEIATYNVKHNYKRVEEDSVVLSREEYEKLKHYEWRVTSGVCMTQKEWFDFCNEDSNRRTCLRIEERERERKETAEKIITFLDDYCDCDSAYLVEQAKEYVAKQFGVEIKE